LLTHHKKLFFQNMGILWKKQQLQKLDFSLDLIQLQWHETKYFPKICFINLIRNVITRLNQFWWVIIFYSNRKSILNLLKIIRNFNEKLSTIWKKSIIFLLRQKFKNPFPTLFSITTKLTKKYILESDALYLKKEIEKLKKISSEFSLKCTKKWKFWIMYLVVTMKWNKIFSKIVYFAFIYNIILWIIPFWCVVVFYSNWKSILNIF
jgi:hypothetical protein